MEFLGQLNCAATLEWLNQNYYKRNDANDYKHYNETDKENNHETDYENDYENDYRNAYENDTTQTIRTTITKTIAKKHKPLHSCYLGISALVSYKILGVFSV